VTPKLVLALLLVGSVLASVHEVRAQASAQPGADAPADTAASEQLFYEGRALMAQRRYAEACTVFQRAERVHTTICVLLNLADCYERLGRIASAWSKFHDAVLATKLATDSREMYARQRAAALASRVMKLTIDASRLRGVRGAEVRVDGESLDRARWGIGLPLDPGTRTVEVEAPGKQSWSVTFDVASSMTLDVPPLKDAQVPVSSTDRENQRPFAVTAQPPSGLGPMRTWALIVGGAGVAAVAAGATFGVISLSKHDDAARQCTNGDNPCSAQGVEWGKEAQSAGNASTVAFVTGTAALTGGFVLWLMAPDRRGGPIAVVPSGGVNSASLSLRGIW
jgi:hypothetical protein